MTKKYYEHPAYIGFADQIPEDDRRHGHFEKEFNERGFDSSITWSLDYGLIKFIYPRLKEYRETAFHVISAPELEAAVDEMLEGFAIGLEEERYFGFDEEDQAKIQRAFDLLAEHRRGLWW